MSEEAEGSEIVTEGGDPLLETEATSERPEWLPEKFKTPEDLVSSYTNLEGKLGQKEEEIKANTIAEIEKERFANRPETSGDYQLPEAIDSEMATDNELLNWWANTSFENGYSQEQFEDGINMYVEAINSTIPDYDEEVSKLGENAEARTEAVSLFANKFFSESHMPAIERLCETADGVEVIEYIMSSMKEGGPSSAGMPVSGITQDELNQMMLDPRYHDPTRRDQTFVNEVNAGFKKLYG
jgi:hypothetical protein